MANLFYFRFSSFNIGGSCHKYHFCRDKHTSFSTKYVSVSTKHVFCGGKACKYLLRQTRFVSTSILLRVSRQTYLFRDKHNFVATKIRGLSRQTRVYRDKTFVAAKMTLVTAPANDIPLCRSHSALPVSSKRSPCRPTRQSISNHAT